MEGMDMEGVAIACLPPRGMAELSFTARVQRGPSERRALREHEGYSVVSLTLLPP